MFGKKKSSEPSQKAVKAKKPIYKRIWFWLLVLCVIGAAMGGNDEEPREEQTAEGQSESQSVEQEDKTLSPEEIKADAKEKNSAIYSTVLTAEASYKDLLAAMETGDLLESYNRSEDLDAVAGECWSQVEAQRDDLNSAYIDACQDYFIQLRMMCDDLQDYLNDQKMEDLSNAQEKIEGLNGYILNLVSEQMNYLTAAGFTADEIAVLLE